MSPDQQQEEPAVALRRQRAKSRRKRRSSTALVEGLEGEEMRNSRVRLSQSSSSVTSLPIPTLSSGVRHTTNDAASALLSPRSADMICFSPKSKSIIPSFRKKPAGSVIVLDMEIPTKPRAVTRDRSQSSPVLPDLDAMAVSPKRLKPNLPGDFISPLSYSRSAKPMSSYHTQWRNPVCQGVLPAGRVNHTAAIVGKDMYVFGGTDGEGLKNQLYVMNLDTFIWSNPRIDGGPPQHRYGHSCTVIGSQLFVFGGKGKDCMFSDTHVFDTLTHTWYELDASPTQGRAYHSAWHHAGVLYVAGGQLYNGVTCNTVSCLDIVTHIWTDLTLGDYKGRAMAGCVPMGKGRAVLVGGIRSSKARFGTEITSKYCGDLVIIDGPNCTSRVVKLTKELNVAGAACTGYGRSAVLSGGTRKGKSTASLIVVDIKTGAWCEEEPSADSGNPPSSLLGHTAVTRGDNLYLFGGKEKSGEFNSTCYWLKIGRSKASEKSAFREPRSRLARSSTVERADLAEVTIVKRLATGGSGSVHLAKWKGEPVVLKKYFVFDPESFEQEVAVLASVSHPNVVTFLSAAIDDDGEQGVLLEYIPLGDLYSVLRRTGPLPWPVALRMARQVAGCMRYLHSLNIIHRDLKSSNLLVVSLELEDDILIKVMDFGDAHELSHHKKEKADACIGTTRWTAPEILEQKSVCTPKSDVFSFAIILWEIVTGKLPYFDMSKDWKVQMHVCDGGRPPIPEDWPMSYKALVQSCWDPIPSNRPSFANIEEMLSEIEKKIQLQEERISLVKSSQSDRKTHRDSSKGRAGKRASDGGFGLTSTKVASKRSSTRSRPQGAGKAVSNATLMSLDPEFNKATVEAVGGHRRERGRHRSRSRKSTAEGRDNDVERKSPSSQTDKSVSGENNTLTKRKISDPIDLVDGDGDADAIPSRRRSGPNSWTSMRSSPSKFKGKEVPHFGSQSPRSVRNQRSPRTSKRLNYRRTSSPSTLRPPCEKSSRKRGRERVPSSPLQSPARHTTESSTGSDVVVVDEEISDAEDDMFLMDDAL